MAQYVQKPHASLGQVFRPPLAHAHSVPCAHSMDADFVCGFPDLEKGAFEVFITEQAPSGFAGNSMALPACKNIYFLNTTGD